MPSSASRRIIILLVRCIQMISLWLHADKNKDCKYTTLTEVLTTSTRPLHFGPPVFESNNKIKHTSLKGITSFPCICLFCSVLPPLPPSAFRAHTCVYVARAKVNVSRSFLPCHVIHDTHICTEYGVTSRVLTYQVT